MPKIAKCLKLKIDSQEVRNSVMPAKAGIQNYLKILDFRLRGNDAKGRFKTIYESTKKERIPQIFNMDELVKSQNFDFCSL